MGPQDFRGLKLLAADEGIHRPFWGFFNKSQFCGSGVELEGREPELSFLSPN